MTRPRPPMQPFEARRGVVGRVEQMSGRVFKVYGFVDVDGSGELTWDVQFPVRFIERPALSFGAELGSSQALQAGSYPTCSVMIKTFEITQTPDQGVTYYLGATLIGVVLGHDGMKSTLHWQLEGKALRNPLNDITTATTDGTA